MIYRRASVNLFALTVWGTPSLFHAVARWLSAQNLSPSAVAAQQRTTDSDTCNNARLSSPGFWGSGVRTRLSGSCVQDLTRLRSECGPGCGLIRGSDWGRVSLSAALRSLWSQDRGAWSLSGCQLELLSSPCHMGVSLGLLTTLGVIGREEAACVCACVCLCTLGLNCVCVCACARERPCG